MPKIMHIITRMDMGGSAQNTLQTCIGLSPKYSFSLAYGLSVESQMTEREKSVVDKQLRTARDKGVSTFLITSLVRKIDPLRDLKAALCVLKIIRSQKPTIVHTHSSKAGIIGRWAAWLSGVPVIVHTPHGHVFYGHFDPAMSKLFLFVERITAKITDIVIALTASERKDYIRFKLCDETNSITIHSGVDLRPFRAIETPVAELKEKLGLDPAMAVVGTVGWLLQIKGPMVLLKAMQTVWRTHPATQLVYVGKGAMFKELASEAIRAGVSDKVKFMGWREDIPNILPLFDFFVLASLNEGMGRVLVEAMAAGCPVIASKTGGIPDLVRHGHNGLLFPPGDEKALAEAILWLMHHPESAMQMGINGKEFCRRFSLEAMLEKLDALYQRFIDEHIHHGEHGDHREK